MGSIEGPYLRPSRIYRLWSFIANHNQLILRSEPSYRDGDQLRAEVYFGNVAFLALTPIHRGLFVREASVESSHTLRLSYSLDNTGCRVYLLDEAESQFIVSSPPVWREAVRTIDEPSLFDFDQTWPPSENVLWGEV